MSADGEWSAEMLAERARWVAEHEAMAPRAQGEEKTRRPQLVAPTKFSLQAFVRMRPLSAAEEKSGEGEINWKVDGPSSITVRGELHGRPRVWTHAGFSGILQPKASNADTFATTIKPQLPVVHRGGVLACFAYGHTGAGKTHTVLGYREEAGVFHLAVQDLFAHLATNNSTASGKHAQRLSVTFIEVYGNDVFDLLNGRTKCNVRQDESGNVHIRAKTVKEDDGRVSVQRLCCRYASTAEEVAEIVAQGGALRVTGSSNVHDQSSRSHAILSVEVVTDAVVDAREAVARAESAVAPAGAARDSFICQQFLAKHQVDPATGERGTGAEIDAAGIARHNEHVASLEREVQRLEGVATEAVAAGPPSTGGQLVFVDLAGAEHGADSKAAATKQTFQERREGRQINTSLLALKECMRSLAQHARRNRRRKVSPGTGAESKKAPSETKKPAEELTATEVAAKAAMDFVFDALSMTTDTAASGSGGAQASGAGHKEVKAPAPTAPRIPFRGSQLTILLKRFLLAEDAATVMVANIAPAAQHATKTINTLRYAQSVAQSAATRGRAKLGSGRARRKASGTRVGRNSKLAALRKTKPACASVGSDGALG